MRPVDVERSKTENEVGTKCPPKASRGLNGGLTRDPRSFHREAQATRAEGERGTGRSNQAVGRGVVMAREACNFCPGRVNVRPFEERSTGWGSGEREREIQRVSAPPRPPPAQNSRRDSFEIRDLTG